MRYGLLRMRHDMIMIAEHHWMLPPLHLINTPVQLHGRIQDFLKGGSENLKKGIWSAAPEAATGICIVKHQNHTL